MGLTDSCSLAESAPSQILLLVNSDPQRLEVLCEMLTRQSRYEVIPVANAVDALKILRTRIVHLVVSNIQLNDLDGWRLARMVRTGIFSCGADVPYIVVAHTWCERIAETTAREYGINKVIPFDRREELLKLIEFEDLSLPDQAEKLSVLAIEDNPEIQELVVRILSHKFTVDVAEDGPKGLAMWKEKKYSLVLLDVMLPHMTGEEVLNEMMAIDASQTVVIMTAHATMEMAEKLMIKGASDFVTKPFRAQQLRHVCESASRREDFVVSNEQFAQKVQSLEKSHLEYKVIMEKHQHLLDHLSSVVIELDETGQISFLNKAWGRLTGDEHEKVIGNFLADYIDVNSQVSVNNLNKFLLFLSGEENYGYFEFKLKTSKNKNIWVSARFDSNEADAEGKKTISGTIDDITAQKQAQDELEYLAMHDSLTGLFNRNYFENKLKEIITSTGKSGEVHSLLYLDINQFKFLNDTLGYQKGNRILRDVSDLLIKRLRHSDIVSRVSGDEFAIIFLNTNADAAKKNARSICDLLNNIHYNFDNQTFQVNCSIGIVEIDNHEVEFDEYLKRVDIALHSAKQKGRNRLYVFDTNDAETKSRQESLDWAKTIQKAIANDELTLFFQPIVDVKTRETYYYESLVRLKINGEIIPPGAFIPALEQAGFMDQLDRQVICSGIRYLHDYPELKKISINLSAQGFSDEGLVPLIQDNLKRWNIKAEQIIFELTESASLNNLGNTQEIINQLGKLGCGFSIDDFGTGFSTFSYLKQLPAKSVKIDGSFIVDLVNNPVDQALVKAIKDVANALDKESIAEYVEDEATLNALGEIGVNYAQGYFISKPMPVSELFK